jgi:hypothetical protein
MRMAISTATVCLAPKVASPTLPRDSLTTGLSAHQAIDKSKCIQRARVEFEPDAKKPGCLPTELTRRRTPVRYAVMIPPATNSDPNGSEVTSVKVRPAGAPAGQLGDQSWPETFPAAEPDFTHVG